ncbi:MAG: M48 family metallopeptidase, partial [Gemmatimonadetes bacterium]|nr:M48 family metallopeptidase [Gemmatimonadota bacterium]
PLRWPLAEVPGALERHARWIARTLARQRRRSLAASRLRVADGERLGLLGEELTLRFLPDPSADARSRVWRDGSEILVSHPPLAEPSPCAPLRAWLRAVAAREIPARVDAAAAAIGLHPERVSVRDQRTKWGACSASRGVSLNWRLVLAPTAVLDYVVVHELCHLRELNHSPRFWALVGRHRPGFEAQRAWLRDNGAALDI